MSTPPIRNSTISSRSSHVIFFFENGINQRRKIQVAGWTKTPGRPTSFSQNRDRRGSEIPYLVFSPVCCPFMSGNWQASRFIDWRRFVHHSIEIQKPFHCNCILTGVRHPAYYHRERERPHEILNKITTQFVVLVSSNSQCSGKDETSCRSSNCGCVCCQRTVSHLGLPGITAHYPVAVPFY